MQMPNSVPIVVSGKIRYARNIVLPADLEYSASHSAAIQYPLRKKKPYTAGASGGFQLEWVRNETLHGHGGAIEPHGAGAGNRSKEETRNNEMQCGQRAESRERR